MGMKGSELKKDLISKITNISNNDLLNDIKELIKFQSDDTVFKVDEETQKSIAVSKAQIKDNQIITNESLQSEIKQWLEK